MEQLIASYGLEILAVVVTLIVMEIIGNMIKLSPKASLVVGLLFIVVVWFGMSWV